MLHFYQYCDCAILQDKSFKVNLRNKCKKNLRKILVNEAICSCFQYQNNRDIPSYCEDSSSRGKQFPLCAYKMGKAIIAAMEQKTEKVQHHPKTLVTCGNLKKKNLHVNIT